MNIRFGRVTALLLLTAYMLSFAACSRKEADSTAAPESTTPTDTSLPLLQYALNDDGASYSVRAAGSTADPHLIIPAKYQDLPVTHIADYAFYECKDLLSVTLPDTVTEIGDYAFAYCKGLENIELSDTTVNIGNGAFFACERLTAANLPASVLRVGDYAYANCSALENIALPDSVTYLGSCAFLSCESLYTAYVSKNAVFIGHDVFTGCNKLIALTVPFVGQTRDGTVWTHFSYFFGDVADTGSSSYVQTVPSSLKTVTITQASHIGDKAFYKCITLKSIVLPHSIKDIGASAFSGCKALESLHYAGPKESWNAVKKGSNWNKNTGAYTIHCTDGDIKK